jgi:hypothetical protein
MTHCPRVLRQAILMAACMHLGCREPKADPTPTEMVAGRNSLSELTSVRRVRAGELCFRSGTLRVAEASRWLNLKPNLRTTVMNSAGLQAAIVFRYLGAAPGRQLGAQQEIGLELLSSDACNLVSTTWRVDERSLVRAAVKTNRDFTRLGSAELVDLGTSGRSGKHRSNSPSSAAFTSSPPRSSRACWRFASTSNPFCVPSSRARVRPRPARLDCEATMSRSSCFASRLISSRRRARVS